MATVKNRIKQIADQFATQSEVQYPSDIFKDSIFQVTIGNKHFTNNELTFFRPPGVMEEETVGLLKKIFQEKYPSTRNNGIPKVPSKLDDKILVIKALQHHFNDIRNLLVKTRDSLSARVELEHLQKIKILIEHFENDKNTFPYHKFQDYIDNQDFIDIQDDMEDALHGLSTSTDEDDRIRKLLRQFARVYLLNKGDHTFVVNDPGLSKQDFQELLRDAYADKVQPSTLKGLLQLLENPMTIQDLNEEIRKSNETGDTAEKDRKAALESQKLLEKDKAAAEAAKIVAIADAAAASEAKEDAEKKAAVAEQAKAAAERAKAAAEMASDANKAAANAEVQKATAEANLSITAAVEATAKANAEAKMAKASAAAAQSAQTLAEQQADAARAAEQIAVAATAVAEADAAASRGKAVAAESKMTAGIEAAQVNTATKVAAALAEKESAVAAAEAKAAAAEVKARAAESEAERIAASSAASTEQKDAAAAAALAAKEAAVSAQSEAERGKAEADTLRKQAEEERNVMKGKLGDLETKAARDAEEATKLLDEANIAKINAEARAAAAASALTDLTVSGTATQEQLETAKAAAETAEAKSLEAERLASAADAAKTDAETRAAAAGEGKAAAETERNAAKAERNAAIREKSSAVEELATANAVAASSLEEAIKAKETAEAVAAESKATAASATASATEKQAAVAKANEAADIAKATATEATRKQAEAEAAAAEAIDSANTIRIAADASVQDITAQKEAVAADAAKARTDMATAQAAEADAKEKLRAIHTQIEASIAAQAEAKVIALAAEEDLAKSKGDLELANRDTHAAMAETKKVREEADIIMKSKNSTIEQKETARAEAELAKEQFRLLSESQGKQITGLETERDAALEEALAVKAKAAEAAAKVAEEHTAAMIAARKDAEATIHAAHTNAANTRAELEASNEQINELQRAIATEKSKQHTAAEEQASLQEQVRGIEETNNALQEQLGKLVAENHALGTKNETLLSDNNTLASELGHTREQLHRASRDQDYVDKILKETKPLGPGEGKTFSSVNKQLSAIVDKANEIRDPVEKRKIIAPVLKSIVQLLDPTLSKSSSVRGIAKKFNAEAKEHKAEQEDLRTPSRRHSFNNAANYMGKHPQKPNMANITSEEMARDQKGGAKLLKYCYEIANNKICDTPYSIIEEFEKASGQDVRHSAHEQFMMESLLQGILEEHFHTKEMKEFYVEAHAIDKKDLYENTKMFFGLLEVCNAIKSSKKDIDVIRLKTSEFDVSFDSFEQKIKNTKYDFLSAAVDELHATKSISMTYSKDHIYFYTNSNSFVNTYSIDSKLEIQEEYYEFNEELYFVNDSMLYLFYILTSYFYTKDRLFIPIGESLAKFERTTKRKKKVHSKSIQKLLQQRIDGRA